MQDGLTENYLRILFRFYKSVRIVCVNVNIRFVNKIAQYVLDTVYMDHLQLHEFARKSSVECLFWMRVEVLRLYLEYLLYNCDLNLYL